MATNNTIQPDEELVLSEEELEDAAGGDPITWVLDHYKDLKEGLIEGINETFSNGNH